MQVSPEDYTIRGKSLKIICSFLAHSFYNAYYPKNRIVHIWIELDQTLGQRILVRYFKRISFLAASRDLVNNSLPYCTTLIYF